MSFESQLICNFLLAINSNLISHHVATMHLRHTNKQMDTQQPVPQTPTA